MFFSEELNQFFDDGDLMETKTFLNAAKNFDVAALEEFISYMQGILLYAKTKVILQKNELALISKLAALNYSQMKKFKGKEKFKIPKFHEVRRRNPELDEEI